LNTTIYRKIGFKDFFIYSFSDFKDTT